MVAAPAAVERLVRLGLVATPGVGPRTMRAVHDACGGWLPAVESARGSGAGVPRPHRLGFAGAERTGRRVAADCARAGVRALLRGDPGWPARLDELPDPPEALFVRGRAGALSEPGVAVVGTRECTADGADLAHRTGERLAEAGWTVVSGLARGIDTAAHRGALAGGGETVAVLGCGPDVAYPPENASLAREIVAHGALASEFPPGVEPRPGHFPRRNRVLAALAGAVLVVESRRRGGALVTVRHALDLGRDVFVVPGWPGTPTSDGPNALLREGARAVRDPDDLLDDLAGVWGGPRPEPADARALDAWRAGARTPPALAAALGVGAAEAAEALARLELHGLLGVPAGGPGPGGDVRG